MAEFALRPKAVADLASIWVYTEEKWGTAQAERYAQVLKEACFRLAANPSIGRSISNLRDQYRMHHVGRHMIIYRKNPKGIEIVRVLHQSMDYVRHL